MGGFHNKFSPSSAEIWWHCPLTLVMREKFPSSPSIYASEGTAMHEIGAKILYKWWVEKKDDNAFNWVGEKVEVDDHTITIDEDMATAVQYYIDCVKAVTEEDGGTGELFIELYQPLLLHNQQCGGTLDAVYRSKLLKKVTVIDLKGGRGVLVDVKGNKQLLNYASTVLESGAGYETYELVIVQPRAPHVDGRKRRAIYTRQQIREHLMALAARVLYAIDHPNEANAGPWCAKFCPGLGKCSAQHELYKKEAEKDFGDTTVLTVEQLADVLERKERIEKWLDAAEKYAISLGTRGISVPGTKVVETFGRRKWVSEEKAIGMLSMMYGDKIYDQKLKSPAAMEKVMGKGKAGKEEFERVCGGLVETPRTGFALVPDTNPKPVIQAVAVTDFDNVKSITDSGLSELGLI